MTERAGGKLTYLGKIAVAGWLVLAMTSFAQTAAAPANGATSPGATPAATNPAFEVNTVKLNKSDSGNSGSNFNNGRFTATNVTLRNVMEYQAFGIPEEQIVGGPKWLNSERFDIEAKVESSVAERLHTMAREDRRALMQAIFQQLLVDRFKLATHWETRELPVYALVVAKKGSLLHETKEAEGSSGTSTNSHGSGMELVAKGITLPELAETLTRGGSRELGRTVADKTGIAGRYDIKLNWTPDTEAAVPGGRQDAAAESGPSLFTAIQEQLGLKLESTKLPVKVLVIDHVEMPTEN